MAMSAGESKSKAASVEESSAPPPAEAAAEEVMENINADNGSSKACNDAAACGGGGGGGGGNLQQLHIRGEGISVSGVTARRLERVMNDLLRRNVVNADDVLTSLRNVSNYGSVTNHAPAAPAKAPTTPSSPSSSRPSQHPHPTPSPSSSSPRKKAKKTDHDDDHKQKKRRSLFATCRTRHVALRLLYDGSAFPNGFAQNVGASTEADQTVKRHLFDALTKTCLVEDRASSGYSRCGRTDGGVSAFGQVISLKLRSVIPRLDARGDVIEECSLPRNNFDTVGVWTKTKTKKQHKKSHKKRQRRREGSSCTDEVAEGDQVQVADGTMIELVDVKEMDYCRILNSVLNDTPIRAVGWSPVTPEFNARFSAKSRTYRYFFVHRDLDLDAMRTGLTRVVGRHDFRNLCKMDAEAVSNFERVIEEAKVVAHTPDYDGGGDEEEDGGEEVGAEQPRQSHRRPPPRRHRQVCHIEIKGQAFLWHMVRCIAAVSFLIGKHREDPSGVVFDDLLDVTHNPGKPSYRMASELPLVLHGCDYANLTFGHSVRNLWEIMCYLETRWEELTLAAARMRNAIDGLRDEATVRVEDVVEFVRECFVRRPAGERRRARRADGGAREGGGGRGGGGKTVDGVGGEEMDAKLAAIDEKMEALLRSSGTTRSGTTDGGAEGGGDKVPGGEGNGMIPWGEALGHLEEAGFVPSPTASDDYRSSPYVKLMDRSRGPTYEEKVSAMKGRKRDRYEENMRKKRRQSTEEDDRFYERMSKQGGTGI